MKAIDVDDGKVMTLGSFNQDHWSFYVNNEANILLEENQTTHKSKAHQQFMHVFKNLQRESRPVDFNERYTMRGYLENAWWRVFHWGSRIVASNREYLREKRNSKKPQ